MKEKIILLCFVLFLAHDVNAQGICSGNLGENIFLEGDFGSGTANVLPTDPGFAPGYNYTTSTPFDGSYTITNNTGSLAGLFPTWISITDNSDDPNGYMMLVNAADNPGIFYRETVDGLCENTLYEFSADVINVVKIGTGGHHDPNLDFLIDGVVEYSSGDVPMNETWQKYGFSFITGPTQTSVELSLRNNAPGGSGNDLALDNISFRPCGPASFIGLDSESTIFVCIDDDPVTVLADIEGDNGQNFAIQWQSSPDGVTWTTMDGSTEATIIHSDFAPGDYYYRYYSAGSEVNILNEKCRIISDILKITVLPDVYPVSDTICEGNTFLLGDMILDTPGFYTENFESQRGCDSTVELDLVVLPMLPFNTDIALTDPSCFGFDDGQISLNSLSGGYGGQSYTLTDEAGNEVFQNLEGGTYFFTIMDELGCEELIEVELIEPDGFQVDIGNDTVIRLGGELLFNPAFDQDFVSYFWNGEGVFDCEDCQTTIFTPYDNAFLSLTVENDMGCFITDSLFISVTDENVVTLPNIFSPNDDNVNDEFTFQFFGKSVLSVEIFVFDRWGNPVFQNAISPVTSGMTLWDGYRDGKSVDIGVYAYKIDVTYINGRQQTIVGDVTVLK